MQRMCDSKEKVSYVNVEDHLDDKATSQDRRFCPSNLPVAQEHNPRAPLS